MTIKGSTPRVTATLTEIDRLRRARIAAHKKDPVNNPPWPGERTRPWPDPETIEEWMGAARMADARRHANVPLSDLDRRALAYLDDARRAAAS